MDTPRHLRDPLVGWALAAAGLVVGGIVASLAFPGRFYEGFIWRYFWGPVIADAHGVSTAGCAVREAGSVAIFSSGEQCHNAMGVVAHPGYTTVSTVSYALVLLFALTGVVLVMNRLDLGRDRSLFFALIPYIFLGGTLRVIEDANAILFRQTGEMMIPLPWVGLIISPLIYVSVFVIAASAFLLGTWLVRRELIDRFEPVFAGIGTVGVLGTILVLGYFLVTTDVVGFYPPVAIAALGGATVIALAVWALTERYWPGVNEGTGYMGPVVVWGHSVDGIANVVSLDWAAAIGLPRRYAPKHVVNEGIQNLAAAIQPAWLSDAIGTAWPFLLVKVIAAVAVVWVFNDEVFEDSPNFAMLMLVAILAVGLGPGTRDFLRATLGI